MKRLTAKRLRKLHAPKARVWVPHTRGLWDYINARFGTVVTRMGKNRRREIRLPRAMAAQGPVVLCSRRFGMSHAGADAIRRMLEQVQP